MFFQKQAVENANNIAYPKYLKLFEKALEANDGQYLVGDSVSLNSLKHACMQVYARTHVGMCMSVFLQKSCPCIFLLSFSVYHILHWLRIL